MLRVVIAAVQGLISHAEVIEREPGSPVEHTAEHNPSPSTNWGQGNSLSSRFSRALSLDEGQVTLYERGRASDTFTLILQGKVLIRTGKSHCLAGPSSQKFLLTCSMLMS